MRILTLVIPFVLPTVAVAQGGRDLMVDEPAAPRDITGDRAFFVATGRALPAGSGYVSASPLWTPAVSFGLPRVTVTAGSPLWLLIDGSTVAFASVKGQVVDTRRTAWSVGAFGLGGSGIEAVWPYVAGTVDVDRVSITALAGVGAGNVNLFDIDREGDILVQGAVTVRVEPNVKLIGEVLRVFENGDPGGLFGARFLGAHWAIDVAAAVTFDDSPSLLPWVSVALGW